MIITAIRAALLQDAADGKLKANRKPKGRQGWTYFTESSSRASDHTIEQMITARLLTRGTRRGLWDSTPVNLTPTGERALADHRKDAK